MKILITGGAGFIGSHIVEAYIQAGHQVLIIDNFSSGKAEQVSSPAKIEVMDINDSKLTDTVLAFKPEIINHQAAQIEVRASVEDPAHDAQINILGSIRLLEAAKKAASLKKVLFASSGGAIYSQDVIYPTEETAAKEPISPYGIAKLSVEHYLHYYHVVHSLPYVALRYANVYGPRQNPHGEAGVVAIFFQRMLAGGGFTINGDGKQTRDFVFVEDVARANLLATESEVTGPFNIGTGVETSINDLTELMANSIKVTEDIPHGAAKTGEQLRSCLSYQKAQTELGWKPQVSLEQGIKKTAEYFQDQQ